MRATSVSVPSPVWARWAGRLPDGRSYSIAVFVMDSREDDRTNAAVIARISRLVYDYAARR